MAYAALILSLIKALLDLAIYSIKRINQKTRQRKTAEGKRCLSLIKGKEYDECTNIIFRRKCKKGNCAREKCLGFTTESYSDERFDPILSSPILLTIKRIIDVFPELAAILIALSIIN